jgi:hypothetical protein
MSFPCRRPPIIVPSRTGRSLNFFFAGPWVRALEPVALAPGIVDFFPGNGFSLTTPWQGVYSPVLDRFRGYHSARAGGWKGSDPDLSYSV